MLESNLDALVFVRLGDKKAISKANKLIEIELNDLYRARWKHFLSPACREECNGRYTFRTMCLSERIAPFEVLFEFGNENLPHAERIERFERECEAKKLRLELADYFARNNQWFNALTFRISSKNYFFEWRKRQGELFL